MKYLLIALVIIIALLALWALGSWLVVRGIETPEYTVVRTTDMYELRQYAPMIVAETVVEAGAEGKRTLAEGGFMRIAEYIFGANQQRATIPMTAPVLSGEGVAIAMTAPVLIEPQRVAFVMPRGYTLETLPTPADPRVVLREVPERTLAVKRFSLWASDARIEQAEAGLMSALARDGVEVVGAPFYAGYNPPLSAPFMQRHEVMVEVEM